MIPAIGDEPVAGYYAARLVRGGPAVGVHIWHGAAIVDGEEQARGHAWRVAIDGETDRVERDRTTGYVCRVALEVSAVWPHCGRWPIDRDSYEFLLRRAAWAKRYAPDHPAANPREPVDFHSLKPRF